jgi:hypothetical protein
MAQRRNIGQNLANHRRQGPRGGFQVITGAI